MDSDTGIGIAEEDLLLIFGRFHRGRNASSHEGNGLGLAIAQAIAERHDGRLHVEPQPVGTRFMLELTLYA